jgi:hypothetical protein
MGGACSMRYEMSIQSFGQVLKETGEPGSSVIILSDYGLDDRAIGVRSPVEAKDFFP